jgi:DNA-binding response OmpR family regulator
MARIFVVEDNESIREAVAGYLKLEDHEVAEFPGVAGVLEAVERREPDLLVLDVMLPDGNGFVLAKKIRARSKAPFLFLTARESESDRITGFEIGADDYVLKPFSPKELALRVAAILRRSATVKSAPGGPASWRLGKSVLRVDPAEHRAEVDGREVALTGAEWEILRYLGGNAGTVMSREKILGECLGYAYEGSERTVDTHVKNLRGKLGAQEWIQTVRGYGYRFPGEPAHD